MGAPNPENPLFLGFSVLRGGITMVSERARPWGRGRSGDCELRDILALLALKKRLGGFSLTVQVVFALRLVFRCLSLTVNWLGLSHLRCDIVGLLQESKRPLPGKLRKKKKV